MKQNLEFYLFEHIKKNKKRKAKGVEMVLNNKGFLGPSVPHFFKEVFKALVKGAFTTTFDVVMFYICA